MSAVPKEAWSVMPMEIEDLDVVERIESSVYAFPWSTGNFRDSLHAGYHCVVWRVDGVVAGYAMQMYAVDEAHLLNITIAPAMQGRGHGSRLLRWLEDEARTRNMRAVFLEVRPSNGGALTLYRRLGYAQIGVRRDYYPAAAGREDALVLKKTL
jgi:ribosomal-protein-alanine N-acetyltransferase